MSDMNSLDLSLQIAQILAAGIDYELTVTLRSGEVIRQSWAGLVTIRGNKVEIGFEPHTEYFTGGRIFRLSDIKELTVSRRQYQVKDTNDD